MCRITNPLLCLAICFAANCARGQLITVINSEAQIRISTSKLRASINKTGYVSGGAGGTFSMRFRFTFKRDQ